MTDTLRTRVTGRLEALQHAHLLRSLRSPSGIDLCSNDYLALADHPVLARRLVDAIGAEGVGSTGSRLLRGGRDSATRVERLFAEFKGTDQALYFSSGYLANIAVMATLPEAGDIIFSDERNHASLIDGMRLSPARCVVFPHCDADTLTQLLSARQDGGQAFIVTESLFSMDGDIAPLADYARLCRTAGATLIVDEAHAVGVYGARASGLIEVAQVDANALVSINTAGKALGVSGAFAAGPAWAIEYLIQRARPFIFSTAPPPALAAALEASLEIIAAEPWRREAVTNLSAYLRAALTRAGVEVPTGVSQIVPLVLGDNERATAVAQSLQDQGFDVRAIRPPSVPAGSARLRISVNARLDEAILDRFVEALAAILERSTPCSVASS